MKTTKFQRVTAFMLALVLLLCGGIISVSADSTTEITTSDIKELLNAISYNDYTAEHHKVAAGKTEIVLKGEDGVFYTNQGVKVEVAGEYSEDYASDAEKSSLLDQPLSYNKDGMTGLYTPAVGTVTWDLADIVKEKTKYSVYIEYYPVLGKSTAVERTLLINGKIPFSEARSLILPKIWKNVYPDGEFIVPKGESADSYLAKAKELGIDAVKKDGVNEKGKAVEIIVYSMPEYWTTDISTVMDEQSVRFFRSDIDGNEIRESLQQAPDWTTYEFKDSNGFYQTAFEVVVGPNDKGVTTLSLESVNEPVIISKVTLVPADKDDKEILSYADYSAKYAGKPDGEGAIKIEAEYPYASSAQTIYPLSDTTSAVNSPIATDRTVLNVIGDSKWQTPGQWVEYKFMVKTDGMYQIVTRHKQSLLDGMYTSRILYLYSDDTVALGEDGYYNGAPFDEARRLQFNYSSDWQAGVLTDGSLLKDGKTPVEFKMFFKAGVEYTVRFEVSLGAMGDVVRRVQESLNEINGCYLNILKLTGATPDEFRDYGFYRIMPDTMNNLVIQANELEKISEEIVEITGEKSSMTATLEKVVRLLRTMAANNGDDVAKNLEQLKTYIGSLGTWLGDAKTQPLTIDYIMVQPEGEKLPVANAGFWKSLFHEIASFFQSFFRNYNRMGATTNVEDVESVEVWLAYGRDQSQVIRGLINDDFTKNTGITVDLKLVAGSTLLPSILSGSGPDVYIGLDQGSVINYAIRGALIELENFNSFDDVWSDFTYSAQMVLEIEDEFGIMHTYGLPETQSFTMMFIRKDILAELDIEIPKTWDDVKEAIPVLQANNMQIGMHNDVKIFLYQMGGELFADGGMRINLDSNVALEAFDTMCDMFTMYSFPYKYDFANRFRTGEMPIGFAAYAGTYNQLKVFATEIEGLWGFYPMPGYEYIDENGDVQINNQSVSTVSAIVMIDGCEEHLQNNAWEFMKWHAGAECQVDYSNEMVAILGPSAKHSTANLKALASLPWTHDEYVQLEAQFNALAAVPNYPGAYIIGRYTQFAFLAAYNDNANPVTELLRYTSTINKEITRKRSEFGLETLDYVGQTLAQKRMLQAETELNEIKKTSDYKSEYDVIYDNIRKEIKGYITEDFATLRAFANELDTLNKDLFADAAEYLRAAADCLEMYEAYK